MRTDTKLAGKTPNKPMKREHYNGTMNKELSKKKQTTENGRNGRHQKPVKNER